MITPDDLQDNFEVYKELDHLLQKALQEDGRDPFSVFCALSAALWMVGVMLNLNSEAMKKIVESSFDGFERRIPGK